MGYIVEEVACLSIRQSEATHHPVGVQDMLHRHGRTQPRNRLDARMASASRIPVWPLAGGLVVLDQPYSPTPTATRRREWKEEVEAAFQTLQDTEASFQTWSGRIRSTPHQRPLQSRRVNSCYR